MEKKVYITGEERAKCQKAVDALWQEWLDMKLYFMAKGTPLMEKGYKGVFEGFPEEKQSELVGRKTDFAKMARGKYVNVTERVRIAVMNRHMPNEFYFVWK